MVWRDGWSMAAYDVVDVSQYTYIQNFLYQWDSVQSVASSPIQVNRRVICVIVNNLSSDNKTNI